MHDPDYIAERSEEGKEYHPPDFQFVKGKRSALVSIYFVIGLFLKPIIQHFPEITSRCFKASLVIICIALVISACYFIWSLTLHARNHLRIRPEHYPKNASYIEAHEKKWEALLRKMDSLYNRAFAWALVAAIFCIVCVSYCLFDNTKEIQKVELMIVKTMIALKHW